MPGAACTRPGGADRDHLGAVRGAAALIQSSTTGARSSTGSSPITTTQVGVADRRERRAERVERGRRLLGEDDRVGAEPAADELRERLCLLDRLGAGEREQHRPASEQRLGLVERVVPGELLEAALADLAQRVASRGRARRGA